MEFSHVNAIHLLKLIYTPGDVVVLGQSALFEKDMLIWQRVLQMSGGVTKERSKNSSLEVNIGDGRKQEQAEGNSGQGASFTSVFDVDEFA